MLVSLFFIVGLILLVIQTTLFGSMPDWLGRPDLLFIFIIFITVRLELIQGAFLVLLLGLVMDIFSGIFLGLYPLTNLILFWPTYSPLKITSLYIVIPTQYHLTVTFFQRQKYLFRCMIYISFARSTIHMD